jgi:hypothetical protein
LVYQETSRPHNCWRRRPPPTSLREAIEVDNLQEALIQEEMATLDRELELLLGGGLHPGDVVEHDQWGRGVVVSVESAGPETEVVIRFEQKGLRRMLLRYAPVKLVV